MSEQVNVASCAGLGWLCLWAFLIWFSMCGFLARINHSLRIVAESQRRMAMVLAPQEDNPIPVIDFTKEVENEDTETDG